MSRYTYPAYKEALNKLISDDDSLLKLCLTKLTETYSNNLNFMSLNTETQTTNSYDKIILEIKQHEKMPEWTQHFKNLFKHLNESIIYAEKYDHVKRYLSTNTFDEFINVSNNISNEYSERTGSEKQLLEQNHVDKLNSYKNIYMPMFLLYCEMFGGFEKIGAKKTDPIDVILIKLKIFIYPYIEELFEKLDNIQLTNNENTNTEQTNIQSLNPVLIDIANSFFNDGPHKYMRKYLILQSIDIICHGIKLYNAKYPIFT
jgi:hypothetical protein